MTVDEESVHALTGAYVLDALEPEELVAFERHLAVCADCRDDVRSLRDAVVRLPAVSSVQPPPELRDSVLAAISQVRPLPPLPEQAAPEPAAASGVDELARRRRRTPSRDRWRVLAAAACVLALAGVAWGVLRPAGADHAREIAVVEQESRVQLEALLSASDLRVYAADGVGGMRGTVLMSDEVGSAVVLLQDLPALGNSEVFQAWTIAGDAPADAGVFRSGDGAATVLLTGDVLAADVVALTIEPTGGSPSPTGDILIQVPVTSAGT
ncbi:anti-sigma factor [Pseudactinotalea sp.]|uniref:anti-sigma factor n=1 Tax=Pseudactinotalea sp. TaxID=1926260 RepID=UPI003B3AD5DD